MRLLLGFCLLLAGTAGATAADIKLMTTGAFRPVAQDLIPAFEKQSGDRVTLVSDTAGALMQRIRDGQTFDVLVLTQTGIDSLSDVGTVVPDSAVPLARVGIGVAVALNAPQPNISSVEGFRRTLLDARRIAYVDPASGATSGFALSAIFQTLGISTEVGRKTILVRGGFAAERVARGEADIALQQASELRLVPTVRFAGLIPAGVQVFTIYSGAISAKARDREAALALLSALSDPGVEPVLKRRGLDVP